MSQRKELLARSGRLGSRGPRVADLRVRARITSHFRSAHGRGRGPPGLAASRASPFAWGIIVTRRAVQQEDKPARMPAQGGLKPAAGVSTFFRGAGHWAIRATNLK